MSNLTGKMLRLFDYEIDGGFTRMNMMNFPVLAGCFSLAAMWMSARLGGKMREKSKVKTADERDDLGVVVGATLTLLGLLIGFTFSMAISRYDQRKTYEEEEANAIGTEYVRADLLPSASGAAVRELLTKYLDQRTIFYETRDQSDLGAINAETTRLQSAMWDEVKIAAAAQPTPVIATVVTGMNDVLNRQGYTQAAWWNRVPVAAWMLLLLIGVLANFLIGYSARQSNGIIFWILPLAVAISFTLIADIDSPRGGLIRVLPQNLVSLQDSIKKH
jgi:hypothetical protein